MLLLCIIAIIKTIAFIRVRRLAHAKEVIYKSMGETRRCSEEGV